MFTEKREFPRGSFFCKITAIFGERLLVFNSYTENISEGGVKVFLEEKLHIPTIVDLELFLEENGEPIKCKGELTWVNEIISEDAKRETLFDTGIKFIEITEADRSIIRDLVKKLTFKEKSGPHNA